MTFEQFEVVATDMWAEIPDEFKEGIDGLVVRRDAETHPEHEDYYTMGMCFTEPYPSGYGGPETTRSFLALFYGSFAEVADGDPDFPWEEELWETITHELRHHLEFMVEDDALEGLDYALEQSYRRGEGLDWDPWFFQSGTPLAPRLYRVEYDVYLERSWSTRDGGDDSAVEFDWNGRRWRLEAPDRSGDLHFVSIPELDAGGGWFTVVFVRRMSLRERLGKAVRRRPMEVLKSEGHCVDVGSAPESPGPEDGRPGGGISG